MNKTAISRRPRDVKPKAYSYLRFSTPEQMQGDSFRRQASLAREWASRNKVELDETLTFHDLGVSAFRGQNADTGKLAEFLEAVRVGLVPRGSYLLVESLDRISRDKARRGIAKLQDICDEGIAVVTLADGKVYTSDVLDDDPMALMYAFMVAIRANEESAMKARRLKAAWQGKRLKAADQPLTSRCPAWLQLKADRSGFLVIKERAGVVRRVYRMLLDGHGQERIAATLNGENVPTFGGAAMWHRSYIQKLTENPATVGVFTPHIVEYVDGKKQRRALDPVPGYFPAIIDEDTFQQAQALRKGNAGSPSRKRKGKLLNLIAGLARCPLCGSTMTRVTKGSTTKAGKPYLVCVRAKTGAGCEYKAVPVDLVEGAIIRNAEAIIGEAPTGDDDLETASQKLDDAMSVVRDGIANLASAIARRPSRALADSLAQHEAELERMEAERKALDERMAVAIGPVFGNRLSDLLDALQAKRLDRQRANALIRQVISGIEVNYRSGRLVLQWKNGGISSIVFGWVD